MATSATKTARSAGPGWLITAAFIGPGTVFTASRAGAQFDLSLLWTIVFAVAATIVLQQMASRLGIVTGSGLGQALSSSSSGLFRALLIALICAAILIGNTAFQAGNLLGAASGAGLLLGIEPTWLVLGCAVAAAAMLAPGYLKLVQWTMGVLVAVMSLAFLATAVLSRPSLAALAAGLVPRVSGESLAIVLALIGTTIVPYNLFLHAQAAALQWRGRDPAQSLKENRRDLSIAICVGGLITASIMVTASSAFFGQEPTPQSAAEVARQLEPALGGAASVLFALGLLAAGFTSSITAPLAAGLATAGCFGLSADPKSIAVRAIAAAVLIIGTAAAIYFGGSPSQTIIAAQILNGLLLPIIAVCLIFAVNNRRLMGIYRNHWPANVAGGGVAVVIVVLAGYQIQAAIARWMAS